MKQLDHFAVVAIPLNRPGIVDFLLPPTPNPDPKGARLYILAQRPTAQAEGAWVATLRATPEPTVHDLLTIDYPQNHLVQTWTDRLVPVAFLEEPGFLTRNLGGWAPIYFGVIGWVVPRPGTNHDPLLRHATTLADYGPHIRSFGADPAQVKRRLHEETGATPAAIAAALARLHAVRRELGGDPARIAARVYAELAAETHFATDDEPPIPAMLLFDELMGQLVRLELQRRRAEARGDDATVDQIAAWQQARREESGLLLILKGEYIVGRHRRSTILIAPELGVVVKQPAPEPFHEIELGAREVDGKAENWPTLTRDGSLVTPRGRIRQVLDEGLIPRLHEVCDHPMAFSALLGLTVEPHVVGPTVQEMVLADPGRLTPALYDVFVLHQQVCEQLGIENGDWHSANFIVREGDGEIVHIDWGAARPLRAEEMTPAGARARLNQVKNIAFSFHDEALAERTLALHADLVADDARLAQIRQRAQAWIKHG